MQLQDWLTEFCKLHERAHQGTLTPVEQGEYLAGRAELARAVLRAQRVGLKPGQRPRQSLRAALALQVVLQLPAGRVQTLTQDISAGGFSVILSTLPSPGQMVSFVLRLAREGAPIDGQARVVGTDPGRNGLRVAFAYEGLSEEAVERIELTVFDSLVAQLTVKG